MELPRTWKPCNNKNLLGYYNIIAQRVVDLGDLKEKPELYIFKSMAAWGKAMVFLHTAEAAVGLNSVFLDEPQKAINTICHELAHCVHPLEQHSLNWQYYAQKLLNWTCNYFDIKTNTKITTRANEKDGLLLPKKETKKQYRYVLVCEKCNKALQYYTTKCKAITYPHLWTHTKCGSDCSSFSIEDWENFKELKGV